MDVKICLQTVDKFFIWCWRLWSTSLAFFNIQL